ncbi:hypothetical protein ACN2MM_10400 [Alkalilimnicola ehrlichii MLHE-1]|uniref:VCBS repeat-containing protein n=1 Tax=Alkalilimnicola ehrlichii (strain ATCC BAA-1101 / DSM 17681 / MLHE-1) TaxID=187272 RepID=Q0A7B4_ALKEH|nr:hypothetical protein [Alkalilimnicola ehrlichii]ABI57273.1 conserved hypothetical protein [Alkalilimnicola ehrlichii MLHE-1]
MHIAEYSIQMASQRLSFEQREVREQWVAGPPPAGPPGRPAAPPGLALGLRGEAPNGAGAGATAPGPTRALAPADAEPGPLDDLKMNLLRLLVERLTGRSLRVISPRDLVPDTPEADVPMPTGSAQPGTPNRSGWGVAYEYHERRVEVESTRFQASGTIHTADGQRIDLAVELDMSRALMEETRLSVQTGAQRLHDPLVINFDGNAAELTETRFRFDLDADGQEQQIAFLQPGSGFLAIDRSGSGRVDNGGELFGPLTGDGFAELRAYDDDRNGWIDADDAVYDRLRVWTRDAEGNDHLLALGEVGVGAIYLGHVSTPFDLRSGANQLQGHIQSTGLWVGDSGRAGTVQHVDLAV